MKKSKIIRKEGYYWVKFKGYWVIGKFIHIGTGYWIAHEFLGDGILSDNNFEKIDENQIIHEKR